MMYRNEVMLSGYLVENFKFHHSIGTRIFEGKIEVERRSGTKDIIILQIPEKRLAETGDLQEGDGIDVLGEMRTYRKIGDDSQPHDKNYVYVEEVKYSSYPYMENQVKLSGVIVRIGNLRRTPLGRKITDVIIAVESNNGYRYAYVPVVFWNEMAEEVSNYRIGDEIKIKGRFQSRDYIKKTGNKIELRTTYEVSAFKLIL